MNHIGNPGHIERTPPHNEEAEQALLGAILINNKAYEKVSEFLRPEHFYDPAHQRIFAAIAEEAEAGRKADPVTLRDRFAGDADLAGDGGGAAYLARLVANVVTVVNARDYGEIIRDTFLRRQLIEVGFDLVNTGYQPDPDMRAGKLIEEAESQLFALGDHGSALRPVMSSADGVAAAMEANERAWKSKGQVLGVTTGLVDLDRKLGGLLPGLYVLGARPSMGKSGLGLNTIMLAAAKAGHSVLAFSTEMATEKVSRRHLAAETGISSDRQTQGDFSEGEWLALMDAQQALGTLPMHIDETPGVTVPHIRRVARRHKRRHGLGLIIVDHLHRMRASKRAEDQGETAKITEITSALCSIWKEFGVPVLLLCQLNRDLERREDKRPNMADLRQSGSIEQDGDVIMFLYRDEYYLAREEPAKRADETEEKYNERYERWCRRSEEARNVAEIIIEKNRDGPIGTVKVFFDGPRTLFSNLDRGE
ncbi:replicative DNA helicase [Azospirillum sp. Marseille-Q6669]